MKDIQNQARVNINTAANAKLASSAAGRSLLQEDTISMNDASEQVIRAQKNMARDSNGYIVNRPNRALLERKESMKMWDATDSIRGREKQLEAVAGRTRVLLERKENMGMWDATDSIRGREKQLEAVAGRTRVLLERKENMKMWDAVDSVRGREKQLEAVAGRTRVLLQDDGPDHGSDRMTANHIRISAAADTVAQAFSRMAMSTKTRINQSDLKAKQGAKAN
jgi:hypothetical protein